MLRLMLNLPRSEFKQVSACYIQRIHQKKVLKFKFEPSYNVSEILTVTVDKEKIMPFLDMSTYLVIYCTYTDAQGSFCSNNTQSIAQSYLQKECMSCSKASTSYQQSNGVGFEIPSIWKTNSKIAPAVESVSEPFYPQAPASHQVQACGWKFNGRWQLVVDSPTGGGIVANESKRWTVSTLTFSDHIWL